MAAAGSQTPRQKMINLMYLVFIAMMAMNVDREVLRSFERVNESLELSTSLTNLNNITFYDNIEKKKADGDEGYVAIAQKANLVRNQTNEVIQNIEAVKTSLKIASGYKGPQDGEDVDYNSLQSSDAVNKVFFDDNDNPTKTIQNMINKIQAFANFMQQGTDKKSQDRIKQLFNFSDKNGKTWVVNQFYEQPMIAALTNLTRLEANIRTEEGNRVRDLLANKLQDEIELRAFVPIVSSPKYVKVGEKFDVVIGFGAYDNTLKGSINLNGKSIPLSEGKAVIGMTAAGTGVQKLAGSISYETPKGVKTATFDESYEVVSETLKDIPTGASVVADKMNVVYRGVENPMSGSVTGVDASTINMSTSNGSLSRSGSGWVYRAGGGATTTFTISGRTSSGKTVSKTVTFRIKSVPKAQGEIRGRNVLAMPASSLPNQTVGAAIPDFEFPVSFNVTGFKVKVTGLPTSVVSGNSLRGASGVLSRAKSGDQVLIFDISATATGVSQQNISPILINVQ